MASLFVISPQMTGVIGVALPLMVAVGTVVGSVLRRWSRKAQEKIAMATGVADEAISNVRTVRAFAMEGSEARRVFVLVSMVMVSHLLCQVVPTGIGCG